jgi:hypothetical protein
MYTLQRDGWTDCIHLFVDKTERAMHRRIAKRSVTNKWKPIFTADSLKDTLGLVKPFVTIDPNAPFAEIFLNEENLGVGVVAHECLHVAMAHERYINHFAMRYDPDNGNADEERLAYYLTSVVKGVYNVLYDNGHCKPGKHP